MLLFMNSSVRVIPPYVSLVKWFLQDDTRGATPPIPNVHMADLSISMDVTVDMEQFSRAQDGPIFASSCLIRHPDRRYELEQFLLPQSQC